MTIFSTILLIILSLIAIFIFLICFTNFGNWFENYLSNSINDLDSKIAELDKEIQEIDEKKAYKEYLTLKRFFGKKCHKGYIVIAEFVFENKECSYLLIGYKNKVSFKRNLKDDPEVEYKKLDELYSAEQVDSVCIKRDWKNIKNYKLRFFKENKFKMNKVFENN